MSRLTKPSIRRPSVSNLLKKSATPCRIGKGHESSFTEVVGMIQAARGRALQAVNVELVGLYWRVGEYIQHKIDAAEWGEAVVEQLADYLAHHHADLKGLHAGEPLPHAAVLYGLPESFAKSRSAAATIAVDP